MGFTDLGFWLVAPIVVGVYYLWPPRWRPALLLGLSLGYYGACSPAFLPLLAAQGLASFAIGGRIARAATDRARLVWLIGGLLPVAGALVLFKLDSGANGLIAPLGISYYTFKLIAYLVEVYWDENQQATGLVDFLAYVSFAPQMVSGPIQRPGDFFAQLPAVRIGADLGRIEAGFALLLDGLLLKLVLADRLGAFIARVDAAPETFSRGVLLAVMLSRLPYLYADFAGYTKIALGLGKLLGIEGPQNFDAPFAAANVQDYWRRWHMSLTGWLTDYVFLPLRMQTRSLGRFGLAISIFVNMLLVGLWHGISWTFFVFGALQGLFMTISAMTLRARDEVFDRWPRLAPWRRLYGSLGTFLLMSASMTIWFAPSLEIALKQFLLTFGGQSAGTAWFSDLPVNMVAPAIGALILAYYHGLGAPGFEMFAKQCRARLPIWVIQGCKLLMLSSLSASEGGSFIYGQF
jgi:hypothetical protein